MERTDGCKGFLYVKCPSCGHERGLYAKQNITSHKCRACGRVFKLQNMVPMKIRCQCGKQLNYMTNSQEKMFDVACIDCGNPVAVEWNKKKGIYQSIEE